MTNANELSTYVYQKLPKIYREEDFKLDQDFPLKRYLESLFNGGLTDFYTLTTNLVNLIDAERCPEELIPFLYRSFGLVFFNDIDIKYHRKFLMNMGEILRRRGTYSCVKYLIRSLTGLEVTLFYNRTPNARILRAVLYLDTLQDMLSIDTDISVVQRFMRDYVPYYITVLVTADVRAQVIESVKNRGLVITQTIFSTLIPAT